MQYPQIPKTINSKNCEKLIINDCKVRARESLIANRTFASLYIVVYRNGIISIFHRGEYLSEKVGLGRYIADHNPELLIK